MGEELQDTGQILEKIRQAASNLGLIFIGSTSLHVGSEFQRFSEWLRLGHHAGMSFLEKNTEIRQDPRKLLPGARSVIVVAMNYFLGDKLHPKAGPVRPRIAQYARLRDYHKVLRQLGEELAKLLQTEFSTQSIQCRVVVDSAPILERAVAARAGSGFIGKNTCFIHPKLGSWLLLAEILTTADLPTTPPLKTIPQKRSSEGGCGSCRRCQVFCPTGALNKDYVLDANLCLAYWTIEHRGLIPEKFWPWMAEYYFGCDICQLICPYNRSARVLEDQSQVLIKEPPSLFAVATMDHVAYERMFGGTPMTRAKRHGLKRNALIAMAVTNDPRLNEAMELAVQGEPEAIVQQTADQIRRWLCRDQQNSST